MTARSAEQWSYPAVPGFKVPGTSEEAAQSLTGVSALRARVLERIAQSPCTPDECAAALNLDRLTVRPRFSELVTAKYIRESGTRRRNKSGRWANVYEVVR